MDLSFSERHDTRIKGNRALLLQLLKEEYNFLILLPTSRKIPKKFMRYQISERPIQRQYIVQRKWLGELPGDIQKCQYSSKQKQSAKNFHFEVSRVNNQFRLRNKLKQLRYLERLWLHFMKSYNFTEKEAFCFRQNLKLLKLLKKIVIFDSDGLKLSNYGFSSLTKSFNNLPFLETIILTFMRHKNIRDEDFEKFSINLKYQIHLKELSLNFSSTSGIADTGLHYLGKSLGSLPSLKIITLFFSDTQITDVGLSNFSKSLETNKSLIKLVLYLIRCVNIVDKGLIDLGHSLLKIKTLRKFSLQLSQNENITEQAITVLSSAMDSLNLREFYLVLGSFEKSKCVEER